MAHAFIPTAALPPSSDGPQSMGLGLLFHSVWVLLPHPGSLHYCFCHALYLGLCCHCDESRPSVAHTYVPILPCSNPSTADAFCRIVTYISFRRFQISSWHFNFLSSPLPESLSLSLEYKARMPKGFKK